MWAGPLLSGLGHGVLIALAIETLPWLKAGDDPAPEVVRVSLVTPAELAALAPPPPAPALPPPAPATPATPSAVVPPPAGPPSGTGLAGSEQPGEEAPPDPAAGADGSLAAGFDAASPLGMAAADDPATAALATDIEPDLAATPLPVPTISAMAPRPRQLRPVEPRPVEPRPEPAPPLAARGAPGPQAEPAPPPAMPSVVVGPVFIDGGQSSAEPTLRPNLPPASGAGVSTYVPPLVIPGDSPALRRPPAGADQAALSAYEEAIRVAVLAAQTYPPEAQTRGVEGTAGLKVIVRRDGRLVTAILIRSTGSSTLDRASLDAVRHAVLPAAPQTLAGDRFAVEVSVAFFLGAPPPESVAPLPPDGG